MEKKLISLKYNFDLDKYTEYRPHISLAIVGFNCVEYELDFFINNKELKSLLYMYYGNIFGIGNDIISYKKEKDDDNSLNIIKWGIIKKSMNEDESKIYSIKIVNSYIKKCQQIKELNENTDIKKLIYGYSKMSIGFIKWCLDSKRYY